MKIILVVAALLPFSLMAQQNQLKATLKNIPEGAAVLLSDAQGKELSSAKLVKGTFNANFNLSSPTLVQLELKQQKKVLDMFLAPGDQVTIAADVTKWNAATVKGSTANDDYALYKQRFTPLKDTLGKLSARLQKEQDMGKRQLLIGEYEKAIGKVLITATNFVKEKPASPVSPFVLYAINKLFDSPLELETAYNELQPAAKTGFFAQILEETIADAKIGAIGLPALEFTQNDTANNPVSLSSLRGKYVLVDFWASWCRPCRDENPNVVATYQQFKDKNFTVLGVSLDQSRDRWLKAIKDDNLTWTHVSDLQYWNNAVAKQYKVESIPQNFLVDPKGIIIAKNLRGPDLMKTLQQLLK